VRGAPGPSGRRAEDLDDSLVWQGCLELVAASDEYQTASPGDILRYALGQKALANPGFTAHYGQPAMGGGRAFPQRAKLGHVGIATNQPGQWLSRRYRNSGRRVMLRLEVGQRVTPGNRVREGARLVHGFGAQLGAQQRAQALIFGQGGGAVARQVR
jgi:hypothetical protein